MASLPNRLWGIPPQPIFHWAHTLFKWQLITDPLRLTTVASAILTYMLISRARTYQSAGVEPVGSDDEGISTYRYRNRSNC